MAKYESELASRCQGVARCLSYNGNEHEAAAKQTLLEAAYFRRRSAWAGKGGA